VALAHHDATHSNKRRSGETPLLSTKQTRDGYVTPCANLAVGLHGDAATEVVEHEGLVRLGKPKLPRQARVLDTRPARCAGTAIVAGN
jgi:hypothetical protein